MAGERSGQDTKYKIQDTRYKIRPDLPPVVSDPWGPASVSLGLSFSGLLVHPGSQVPSAAAFSGRRLKRQQQHLSAVEFRRPPAGHGGRPHTGRR